MKKTAIVTDSNSGITQKEAAEKGIYVIPMPFMISGKTFLEGQDLTKEQFYSTASYKSGDLSGILLWENDLGGWDFGGKNLTDMDFKDAVLTGANFIV